MCTRVWSIGEASQAKNSRMKVKIEESRGPEVEDVEDDSAKNTPSSDKLRKDAPQSFGELDTLLPSLVPRALHTDLGLGSGNDVAPLPLTGTEEMDHSGPLLELGTLVDDVEMQPTVEEDEDHDGEGDAGPSGGGDSGLLEVQGDVGGETAEKLGESDKDKILQELRAEIAALKGQTCSPSALEGQNQSPSAPEPSQKGVVRNVPVFKVWQPIDGGPVKTRSVVEVAPILKPTAATTRNMSKTDKVRTRGDGPAKPVDLKQTRKKAQKRPKVDVPKPSPDLEDEVTVSVNGDPQPPPAKVKRTAKK